MGCSHTKSYQLKFNRLYNAKIYISYQGTDFTGWHSTKIGSSISEKIEKALSPFSPSPIILNAASRTDSGVHANNQVISTKLPSKFSKDIMLKILNSKLPLSIRILNIEEVHDSFHATCDAISKEYVYKIDTRKYADPFKRDLAWHYPYKIDISKIHTAIPLFIGTHDFTAFANPPMHPKRERTLYSIAINENDLLEVQIRGKSFLHNMVRVLIGTLLYIGEGKISVNSIKDIFASKDRRLSGPTAPAHGLYLDRVYYSV